jgi:hypothetical protein
MPRKPSDIVQYKLRIRESLRRRIEKAAKKNKTSANQEMANRLEHSFDQEQFHEIENVTVGLKASWFRVESLFARAAFLRDLVRAANELVAQIEQLPAETQDRAALKAAVEQVKQLRSKIESTIEGFTNPDLPASVEQYVDK